MTTRTETSGRIHSRINVTPMVDVMLVLHSTVYVLSMRGQSSSPWQMWWMTYVQPEPVRSGCLPNRYNDVFFPQP